MKHLCRAARLAVLLSQEEGHGVGSLTGGCEGVRQGGEASWGGEDSPLWQQKLELMHFYKKKWLVRVVSKQS